MLKRTKCNIAVAMLVALAVIVTACEHEDYDEGDGTYSLMTTAFGEAYTDEAGTLKFFITDNGQELTLTPQIEASGAVADTFYRRLLYYDVSTTTSVKPRAISAVPVVPLSQLGAIGNDEYTDPFTLESLWMSASGKYINIGLYVKSGEADGSDATYHTFGLSHDSITTSDTKTTFYLCLRHDQGGIPEYYSSKIFLSIATTSLEEADSVVITFNTYDGIITKAVAL